MTKALLLTALVEHDENWGIDHVAWSVIKHQFPATNIQVIQMSIDFIKPDQYHFDLAKQLSALRNKGILFIKW